MWQRVFNTDLAHSKKSMQLTVIDTCLPTLG